MFTLEQLLKERQEIKDRLEEVELLKNRLHIIERMIVVYGNHSQEKTISTPYGSYPCDAEGCKFIASAPQGLGAHKRHAHNIKGRTGQTSTSSSQPLTCPFEDCPQFDRDFKNSPNLSSHLRRMHKVTLIKARKDGLWNVKYE